MRKNIIILFLTLIPSLSMACSVCYGANSNDELSQGLNMAIIALIGVTGTVLGGIISFVVFLNKRQKQINKELKGF
tara:strand:- start:18365 stop:18592 length:228 start_codon:yes stop_codon:yes gene_type:complete